MGVLTEEMTRLCGEIVSMRRGRQALNKGLAKAGIARKVAVQEMCAELTSSRLGMARKTRQERRAFLNNVKGTVHGQREAMRADLAGAHRAWAGKGA